MNEQPAIPDPAADGPNSISPVGRPEGGAALGHLRGANPAEAVPDAETLARQPEHEKPSPIGSPSIQSPDPTD